MDFRRLDLGVEVAGPGLRAHRCHSVQDVRGMKSNDGLGPSALVVFSRNLKKGGRAPIQTPGGSKK